MPSDIIRKDQKLVTINGSLIKEIQFQPGDKNFAVILQCGHCGVNYFIPIMFTKKCADSATAIEWVKSIPRVKRDKKDVVLAVFEVDDFQKFCIESINDHDPYLRSFYLKGDEMIERRKVMCPQRGNFNKSNGDDEFKYVGIKTADQYEDYDVLERAFAPRYNGSKLIFPTRINKDELLNEFFTQKLYRYGLRKANPFFIGLYYQMFGPNNELGVRLNGHYFQYDCEGKRRTCPIPDEIYQKVVGNIRNIPKEKEEYDYMVGDKQPKISQIEKFNERMKKFKQKNESSSPKELGAE